MKKRKLRELLKMPLDEVIAQADHVRRERVHGDMEFCGIVNAKSGMCGEDCGFCAQSSRNPSGSGVYPLIDCDRILQIARKAVDAGAQRVGIVTSGNSLTGKEIELVSSAIKRFSECGILPCASLGKISLERLDHLMSAGLRRYHHNIETSERFFPRVVTTHSYKDRIRTILTVKSAGLEICSGGIFGLGETWEDRIDMALELKELEVDSVPINFLVPIEGTPMGKRTVMSAPEALRIIAIFRIVLGKTPIKVAAGREPVLKDLQKMIFSAGANGMMVGGYLTVPGAGDTCDRALIREVALSWGR